jgi:hypothetical protein
MCYIIPTQALISYIYWNKQYNVTTGIRNDENFYVKKPIVKQGHDLHYSREMSNQLFATHRIASKFHSSAHARNAPSCHL